MSDQNKEVLIEKVKKGGYSPEAVKVDGYSLEHTSEELKNDKEVVLEAVKQYGISLKYASEELKNDKEVVMEAVKQNGSSLEYSSEELKNEKKVVLEAVKQDGESLRFASEELKNDKEVAMKALKQDAYSLVYTSEELKNDKVFILEVVKQDGDSLRFASEELKNDKEIVLEAVTQDGRSLEYASEELKNDVDFVIECCKIDRSVIVFIGGIGSKDSLLAEKMNMFGTDVERAFEEFERERKTNPQILRNNEEIWVKLCCDLFKKKWENVDKELLKIGKILEETLRKRGLSLSLDSKISSRNDLEELKKNLQNERSLFEKIQKWFQEVESLRLEKSENDDVFFSRFKQNTEDTNQPIDFDSTSGKNFKDLEIFRVLGSGSFARTYLCRIDGCFGLFVVKLYKGRFFGTLSEEREKRFLERDHLQIPHHENVVPILYHSEYELIDLSKLPDFEEFWKNVPQKKNKKKGESETIRRGGMLIMKYHQTTLSSVIIKRSLENLKEKYYEDVFYPSEVILIMRGIISGVFHLHDNHIVHRDLHSGNIFIHLKMGRVWIGDYGCSLDLRKNTSVNKFRVHRDHEILYSVTGNLKFSNKVGGAESHCPPEILNFEPSKSEFLDYSKSDLYSCGVIGKELFNLVDEERKDENSGKFWKESETFQQYLESLLVEFEKRIDFDDAFNKIGIFDT